MHLRPYHAFSCELAHEPAAERHGGSRHLTTTRSAAAVTPCKFEMQQALQRRASERPLVGYYAELGSGLAAGPQLYIPLDLPIVAAPRRVIGASSASVLKVEQRAA